MKNQMVTTMSHMPAKAMQKKPPKKTTTTGINM